jgi:hypothetical protein
MSYRGRNAHASLEKYSSRKPALENRLVKVGPHSRIRYVTVRPASVPPLGQRSSGRMGDRYFGVLAPLTVKSPPRRLNESIDCTGMCFMANALARKAPPPAYWRSAQAVGAFALAIGALTLARLAIRRGTAGSTVGSLKLDDLELKRLRVRELATSDSLVTPADRGW